MGRIKTTLIKRVGKKIYAVHKERFSKDFETNKKALPEVAEIYSKKLRNVIAGYITRLAKKEE